MSTQAKPLRLGILLRNRHDGPGGLEKVLQQMIDGLQTLGVEIYLYSLYPLQYREFIGDAHYYELPLPSLLRTLNHQQNTIQRALTKLYIRFWGYKLFKQIERDQVDCLITLDLSRQYCQNYRFLKRFKAHTQIPIFSWIHGTLSAMHPRILKQVRSKIELLDGHLAISHGIENELRKIAPSQPIKLIYNPIQCASSIPRDPRRFLYIGRIDANKRVISLLRKLTQLHGEWHLDIYGSCGSDQKDQELLKLIDSLQLQKNVTFHGWSANPWQHIQRAGVLLLNSRYESFSLVISEAMMRGIPVISANSPVGPAELIKPGVNGWLYPVEDEDRGIQLIQEVIDGSRTLPPQEEIQASVSHLEANRVIQHFQEAVEELIKHQTP